MTKMATTMLKTSDFTYTDSVKKSHKQPSTAYLACILVISAVDNNITCYEKCIVCLRGEVKVVFGVDSVEGFRAGLRFV
ncbi:hypothetical protein HanHA300_Chr14g0530561 [Helianthus annuus]|nr:hypothetical protein HanHA300_Chr14g0530561 [Helianthus annuus]KAJ0486325.1 hypothetical protein HanHA89_Chr14g0578441 [Helianthus annuus]KAJ0656877.1 hypothetical protein HanLR1_Chr14g0540861 [Helianthus annuus]KAJ0660477.1 hypothetical protein HanOQP8_Chr14g0538221 [Helianthus annuus]